MSARPTGKTLQIEGISQRFGERQVLDDVGFTVAPGRITGLLGPNGAGKTTLMRILFGVVKPDAGRITWGGQEVSASDRTTWGYMPQERGLYVEMRVLDQLVWFARLHGIAPTEAREKAESLLERLDLADRARDNIRDLSGGMAQRVQLAAAMVHEPDFLVLDEPFAGLDPTAVEFLSKVVIDHVAAGRTLLFSSHQLDLVEELCEWIVMIDHGVMVLDGDLAEQRAASTDRYLSVELTSRDVGEPLVEHLIPAVLGDIVSVSPTGMRVRLAPGSDAAQVLDRVRARYQVGSFAVETPRLSEMFLGALNRSPSGSVGVGT